MLTKKAATVSATIKSPFASAAPKAEGTNAKALQGNPKNSPQAASVAPKTITAKGIKQAAEAAPKAQSQRTRISIKYDVGFANHLTIRGNGANLSWDKGQPLRNVKADEWVWESDAPFTTLEFKVLINDKAYELGENRRISCRGSLEYTPRF